MALEQGVAVDPEVLGRLGARAAMLGVDWPLGGIVAR